MPSRCRNSCAASCFLRGMGEPRAAVVTVTGLASPRLSVTPWEAPGSTPELCCRDWQPRGPGATSNDQLRLGWLCLSTATETGCVSSVARSYPGSL